MSTAKETGVPLNLSALRSLLLGYQGYERLNSDSIKERFLGSNPVKLGPWTKPSSYGPNLALFEFGDPEVSSRELVITVLCYYSVIVVK